MATTVARLEALLTADTRQFDRAMDRSDKRTSGFGSRLSGLTKTAGIAAGAAGLGAIVYTLKTGIGEWKQHQVVAAQTNAVLKSTASGAHVTAREISSLATSLMRKSGIDDEAIQSGENLLLTFRNIRNETGKGNDMFNQATKAVVDFSVAFHKDLNQSAILVGKALNDPIKGLTALQRVGVTFTAAQREQIKALVDSGQTMKAQKLIMAELHAETAGSAEAYGKTLPGMISIAKESFKNWAGELVTRMIPVLQRMVAWVRAHWPEITAAISTSWASIRPILTALGNLVVSVVALIRNHWSTIGPLVRGVTRIIRAELAIIAGVIKFFAATLRGDWSGAWNALKGIVSNAFKEVRGVLAFQKDLVLALAKGIGTAVWSGFTAAISAGFKAVKQSVRDLFGKVIGWVKDVLGIGSPSKVFHEIGRNVVHGFVRGVGSMAGVLKSAVIGMVKDAASNLLPGSGTPGRSPRGGGPSQAGGFLPAGAEYVKERKDQGRDLKTNPGGPIIAPGAGVVTGIHSDPGGFGPDYPTVRFVTGAYAGRELYIGHTHSALRSGARFKTFDVLSHTGYGHGVGNATVPGWAEIGYWPPSWNNPAPFDKGGWLKPGLTLAVNNTGRPERVLGPGEGGTVIINFPNYVGDRRDLISWMREAAQQFQRQNGKPAFGGA